MSNVVSAIPSAVCLIVCLAVPLLHFQGRIEAESYKSVLFAASVGWFVCAAVLAARKKA